MKKCRSLLFLLLAGFLLYGCSAAPNRFVHNSDRFSSEDENDSGNSEMPDVQAGIASYYAEEFDGKPTASGEIYDMYKVSAAHPYYPLGTCVRVTNLVNNKSIVLIINDRMPFRPDRIIDLSYGAAKALGMLIQGIQKVKVEVIKWGTGKSGEYKQNPI